MVHIFEFGYIEFCLFSFDLKGFIENIGSEYNSSNVTLSGIRAYYLVSKRPEHTFRLEELVIPFLDCCILAIRSLVCSVIVPYCSTETDPNQC